MCAFQLFVINYRLRFNVVHSSFSVHVLAIRKIKRKHENWQISKPWGSYDWNIFLTRWWWRQHEKWFEWRNWLNSFFFLISTARETFSPHSNWDRSVITVIWTHARYHNNMQNAKYFVTLKFDAFRVCVCGYIWHILMFICLFLFLFFSDLELRKKQKPICRRVGTFPPC